MEKELNEMVNMDAVKESVQRNFERVFNVRISE
jgi:predicted component of type VI protein secretion system